MDKIFIRINSSETEDRVYWLRTDNKGEVVSNPSKASLDELADISRSTRVIVLVPGQDVLLTRADVPARNRRQITQALPYALEDQLAQEVDCLHFALDSSDKSTPAAVAVVSKDCMTRWQNKLGKAGIRPAMIVPDTLAIPVADNQWSLLADNGMTLVRTGVWDGFAVDAANAPLVLQAALNNQSDLRPENLRLIYCGQNERNILTEQVSSLGLETEVSSLEQDSLTYLVQGFREHETINLLQGEFSHRRSLSSQWRPWIPALIIALLWFGLETGVKLFENHRLDNEKAKLAVHIENIYRETFPDTRKIVNPRVQMTQRLQALGKADGNGKDFLDMLAASGELLYNSGGIQLTGIRYRSGSLHLDVEAKELAILDRLKAGISAQTAYGVEILSATAGNGRVRARLEIGGTSR